ncbi:glycosyltransferase family 2 protein [Methylolobus aquaticus]
MDPLSLALFLLLWCLGFLLLWRVDSPSPTVPDCPAASRTVSVIIPARNEAANLGPLLQSLREQTLPPAEVIVVDDQSTDRTASVALSAGARVITTPPLPEGWCGKPWACWQGAHRATGAILAFLDADTRLEPDGLRRLTGTQAEGGGLVSVQPYHRMSQPHEQLAAFFNIVSYASLAPAGPFGRHRMNATAFGPCNICAREDYFTAGGHRAAAGAVIESLPLGRAFVEAGLPLRSLGGKGTVSFRMYQGGLHALEEGFGKSFAVGVTQGPPWITLLISGWLIAAFEPIRHLIQAGIVGNADTLAVWSACYFLFAAQLHWMLARLGNFHWTTALAYPVPLMFFVYVFIRAQLIARLTGKVTWKGRTIDT